MIDGFFQMEKVLQNQQNTRVGKRVVAMPLLEKEENNNNNSIVIIIIIKFTKKVLGQGQGMDIKCTLKQSR